MLTSEEISAAYDQGPEALIALVASLWGLIDHQQVQVAELRVWVKALADQLATHSRNRSKPPASESFPPPPRSLRQPSGRPAGGQRGHRGTTLPPVALPDQARIYEPAPGVACGAALAAVAGQPDPERRPVFDLPPLKLEVTAHRVLLKECAGCGHRHRGPVPEGVAGGARSGAGVKSVLTYLTQRQLLPSARRSEIVADLWGQPGSAGLLAAAVNDGPTALGETATSIQPGLARAEVGNVDETGMAVAGQRRWRHSASTPPLTHYAWHDHRGATATQAIGILPACGGRASHDGCSAYWPDDGAHGLCHAPHWRALIFAHEQGQRTGAGPMKAWLGELKRAGASAPAPAQPALAPTQIADYEPRSGAILQAGWEEEHYDPSPPRGQRGRKKPHKSQNLLDRLAQEQADTLAFRKDCAVPFDNNLAARDLRMRQVKQKVSGCFRPTSGAQALLPQQKLPLDDEKARS